MLPDVCWATPDSRGFTWSSGAAHGIPPSLFSLPPPQDTLDLFCSSAAHEFLTPLLTLPSTGFQLALSCLPLGLPADSLFLPAADRRQERSQVSFTTLSVGALRGHVFSPWTGQVLLHNGFGICCSLHPEMAPCALPRPVGCLCVRPQLNQPPDGPWGPLTTSTMAPFLSLTPASPLVGGPVWMQGLFLLPSGLREAVGGSGKVRENAACQCDYSARHLGGKAEGTALRAPLKCGLEMAQGHSGTTTHPVP